MRLSKGFTIIELVISVVIIAGVSTVIAQTYFAATRSAVRIEAIKDIKQNGDFATNVMTRMIHNAKKGSLVCPPIPGDSLTITNPDGGQTTFKCVFDSGVPRIASISAILFSKTEYLSSATLSLTPFSNITPTNCTGNSFVVNSCDPGGGAPGKVSVSFSLFTANVPSGQFNQATTNFSTTVTMRN